MRARRKPTSKQRSNARSEKSGRARQYRGIVVDLRLFRMRSDRDAINNDALTDPMAGGRPHESHDLTFAWVGCPRPIASARARARLGERADRDAIFTRAIRVKEKERERRKREREKRESNFKCNGYRHHRCAAVISRARCVPSLSLSTRPPGLSHLSPNRLFTFSDVSTSSYFLGNHCPGVSSVACVFGFSALAP